MAKQNKKNIVVIEDNSGIRLSLEIALKNAGYAVTSAEDGEAGIILVRNKKPDLVILDLFLPVLDGFKVMEQFNAEYGIGKLPVVIFSVLSQDGDRAEAQRLGAAGYIVKSEVSIEDVVKSIGKYLH